MVNFDDIAEEIPSDYWSSSLYYPPPPAPPPRPGEVWLSLSHAQISNVILLLMKLANL